MTCLFELVAQSSHAAMCRPTTPPQLPEHTCPTSGPPPLLERRYLLESPTAVPRLASPPPLLERRYLTLAAQAAMSWWQRWENLWLRA